MKKTLKTILEAELGPDALAQQIAELQKAQAEIQAFYKQNPALGQNQQLIAISNKINGLMANLKKSNDTMLLQKRQQDAQAQKQATQSGQIVNTAPKTGTAAPQQQATTAQSQANVTPKPGTPVNANGMTNTRVARTA